MAYALAFKKYPAKCCLLFSLTSQRIIPRRNSVKLYSYFRSSAAYRVRIALNLKNSKLTLFRFICLKMAVNSKVLRTVKLTQSELVPALLEANAEQDFTLTQSLSILEYLDESLLIRCSSKTSSSAPDPRL
jgi:hypothetical protein